MNWQQLKILYEETRETRQGPGSGWHTVHGPKAPVIDAQLWGDSISLRYRYNSRDGDRNRVNVFAELRSDGTATFQRFRVSQASLKIARWLGLSVNTHNGRWVSYAFRNGMQYFYHPSEDFTAEADPAGYWVPVEMGDKKAWLDEVTRRARALKNGSVYPEFTADLTAEIVFKHALLGTVPRTLSIHPSLAKWVAGVTHAPPPFTDAVAHHLMLYEHGHFYTRALQTVNCTPPEGWTPWTK